jgi:hypothetical protein
MMGKKDDDKNNDLTIVQSNLCSGNYDEMVYTNKTTTATTTATTKATTTATTTTTTTTTTTATMCGDHNTSTGEKFGLLQEIPNLQCRPPRKVCLMVEPTPFSYVSGYSNRFKEMLKNLRGAGDNVTILTTDSRTIPKQLPDQFVGYPIQHTKGFPCPFYDTMSITMDLPQMKGIRIVEQFSPDLIHATSPGLLVFAALFYARMYRIPLLISYHTHLPVYGMYKESFFFFLFF